MADFNDAPLNTRILMAPHAEALGLSLVSIDKGRSVMSAPWREELVGDPESGVIASGVVTALLDHTCSLAVDSAIGERMPFATLDLRIDYLRAAAPGAGITAEAHAYRLTRTVAFVRAEAWDVERSDLVATAQAAFMLNTRAEPLKA